MDRADTLSGVAPDPSGAFPERPHRFPHLEDADPQVRYQRLWNARSLGRNVLDPDLYAYAFRRFLLEDDAKCRGAAIWVMRDAWKVDRPLRDAPVGAALIARSVGTARRCWTRVAALLADPEVRRTVAPGEHLQWIARQVDEDALAPLAADLPAAFRLADTALQAAQDPKVRKYPRAAFVQLAGRVAGVAPEVRPQVAAALRQLAETSLDYDIRYWVDRVLAECGGDDAAE